MDIDSIIKEITEEVMKSIRQEETPAPQRGRGSAYDLGPCAEAMRRENASRNAAIGRGSCGRSYAGAERAEYACSTRQSRRGSAYDYQTRP